MTSHDRARRRFLVATMALSGAAGTLLGPHSLLVSRAWAESTGMSDDGIKTAMVRMARLLFPHDAIPDAVYARVLDGSLSAVTSGAEFRAQIDQVAGALDARVGGSWVDQEAEAQLAALRSIESEVSFLAIQNAVRAGIYNSPEFWKHVGYPGPSKGFGGYLHRGAGDVDWLPETRQ